jgi:hypothetical protein
VALKTLVRVLTAAIDGTVPGVLLCTNAVTATGIGAVLTSAPAVRRAREAILAIAFANTITASRCRTNWISGAIKIVAVDLSVTILVHAIDAI